MKNFDNNTKVLVFMNTFTSGKSGGDVAFIEIFKRLNFQNLTVLTSLLGKKLCVDSGLNVEYVLTTNENQFKNILATYFFRILNGIIFCINTKKYDLIYSSSDALPDILPAVIYRIKNKNTKWVVKRYHDIPKKRLISYFFQKISMILVNRFSDRIIQDGKFGFDHIDYDKIPFSKQKYDAVFMSRLHSSKGIFDLIEIWKNVVGRKPTATLGVIGAGLREIKNNLPKNIKILGFLDENQAFSYIKSSKLFLFPSHEEAFGIVLGEAMMCKTPIISYALPNLNWCRDYVFSVPCFEKKYFAKMVCELLMDDKKRIKHIEKAYRFAKSFTWEKAAEKELNLIKSIS